MKNLKLEWKEFNLDLDLVQENIKALVPGQLIGMSAGTNLTVHLSDEVTDTDLELIQTYYNEITESSNEASSYRTSAQIMEARDSLKVSAISKSWDQMTVLERKVMLNMNVSKQELIDAGLL